MVYTTKSIAAPVAENVDILGSAPSTAVLPSCGTFLETAMYIASFCEEAYTDLMTSVGLEELAVYESTGAEVVYEAEEEGAAEATDAKKNLDAKTDNFLKNIWERIKKMFETAVKWISDKVNEWKKNLKENKITKFDDLWTKKSANIPNDKKFGKASFITKIAITDEKSIIIDGEKYIEDITATANKFANGENPEIAVKVYGKTYNNFADIKKAIYDNAKEKEPVEITKDWITKHKAEIGWLVVDGKSLGEVKKLYGDAKKAINVIAKNVKSNKKATENYKSVMAGIAKCSAILSGICGAELDIAKNRYVEASRILAAALNAVLKAPKAAEEKKDEKAEAQEATGESAVIAGIEEAFNW